MRTTHRCPKCNHDRILHVAEVAERMGDSWAALDDEEPIVEKGLFHTWRLARVYLPARGTDGAAGLVEAYVCRACGYTELYTRRVEMIEPDGEHIRELRPPEGAGPYR